MPFFTLRCGRSGEWRRILLLWVALGVGGLLHAQVITNTDAPIPDPTALETPGATARASATNAPAAAPLQLAAPVAPAPAALPTLTSTAPVVAEDTIHLPASDVSAWSVAPSLLTLSALAGFLLYQCGMTRAKNCGHTATLLLLGALFALVGYWIGGFALQTGGVGDAHAALAQPVASSEKGALDHELGFMLANHHWGLMGNSGFFLMTDEATRNGIATLFLGHAVLLAIAVAAALGAALERGRLLAMAVVAFLIGTVIYPLFANWVWGGGWLAALGHEFGLGHGVIDLAGAGVVHLTAGTLALVIALVLGPRQGRFNRAKPGPIPGHNVPFTILGAFLLLVAWMTSNAFAFAGESADGSSNSTAALAAVNVFLGAAGGALISVFAGAWRKQRPTPARLTRGLLGGAVALSAGSSFFDPWAALLIGVGAGFLVDLTMAWLERRSIDDPIGATAIHGASGAWGLLAVGIFANGTAGRGMNGIDGPVRGLFFGGSFHQLAAQALGCVTGFVVVFILGYVCLLLVQKILGSRVKLADEIQGLDWPQVGALGYQPDVESEEATGR